MQSENSSPRTLLAPALVALCLSSSATVVCAHQIPGARTAGRTTTVESVNARDELAVRVHDLGAVEARDAALLLSGRSGGNLPGAVLWCAEPEPGDGGRVIVHLHVELSGKALLEDAEPGRVPVVIVAYAIDEQGAVVESLANGVLVEGEGLDEALMSGGLKFVGSISLPPGVFSLRAMARIHGSARLLLTREELRVGPAGMDDPAVSAPLFATPEGAWIEARQPGLPTASAGVNGLVPAAKPVLDPTLPMRFVVVASNWPEGAHLESSVVSSSGRLLEQPKLSVGSEIAGRGGRSGVIEIEMQPFDVPPGEVRLTLHLMTAAFETVAARGLDAVLEPGGTPAIWPALDEPGGSSPVPAPATIAAGGGPGKRQMQSAYVAALGLLAAGDETAARRSVADLEREVLAADPKDGIANLRTTELRVAVELGDRAPRSLPSLLVLHSELCKTYTAFRNNVLAQHSAIVTLKLAEMIGTITAEPARKDPAEAALVSVALDLIQSADYVAGDNLLERILELDSKSLPTLEILAALRERTGRRNDAVALLRELVSEDPENLQAQLRLGVNLRRTGRLVAAQKELRPLLVESTPEWIRVLAVQELVHLLVSQGNLDEAEELLLRTIDGVEDQQTLAILLAWTRDLTGRVAEASATLNLVEHNVGRREDSARRRYCQWPELGIHGVEFTLRQIAQERLPDLRRALASEGL